MKIIIKRTEPFPYSHNDYNEWVQPIHKFMVYVEETKLKNKIAEFTKESEALGFVEPFKRAGAEVITSWNRSFRVTTTVIAKTEEEALDRLCGDDIEARKLAVVVTV